MIMNGTVNGATIIHRKNPLRCLGVRNATRLRRSFKVVALELIDGGYISGIWSRWVSKNKGLKWRMRTVVFEFWSRVSFVWLSVAWRGTAVGPLEGSMPFKASSSNSMRSTRRSPIWKILSWENAVVFSKSTYQKRTNLPSPICLAKRCPRICSFCGQPRWNPSFWYPTRRSRSGVYDWLGVCDLKLVVSQYAGRLCKIICFPQHGPCERDSDDTHFAQSRRHGRKLSEILLEIWEL